MDWQVYRAYGSNMTWPIVIVIAGEPMRQACKGVMMARVTKRRAIGTGRVRVRGTAQQLVGSSPPPLHSNMCSTLCQHAPPSSPAAALFVGQGVYLYSDYWIAIWSSKSEAEQQEVRAWRQACWP